MNFRHVLFPIFLLSCNSQDHKNFTKNTITVNSLKNNLLGSWGGLGESIPVLEIGIDSIYYYQEKKAYPYKVVDRNLIIERTESKGVLRNISVIEDTMIFYDEQGLLIKGYRFRSK